MRGNYHIYAQAAVITLINPRPQSVCIYECAVCICAHMQCDVPHAGKVFVQDIAQCATFATRVCSRQLVSRSVFALIVIMWCTMLYTNCLPAPDARLPGFCILRTAVIFVSSDLRVSLPLWLLFSLLRVALRLEREACVSVQQITRARICSKVLLGTIHERVHMCLDILLYIYASDMLCAAWFLNTLSHIRFMCGRVSIKLRRPYANHSTLACTRHLMSVGWLAG